MKNVQVNGKTYQPHEMFQVIDEVVPYDGPHDAESIHVAMEILAHTARQLANATQMPQRLSDPSDMYHVIGSMTSTMSSLVQVSEQLQRSIETAANDDRIRDTNALDDRSEGYRLAFAAEQKLLKVQRSVFQAYSYLSEAWTQVGNLVYVEDGEEATDGA